MIDHGYPPATEPHTARQRAVRIAAALGMIGFIAWWSFGCARPHQSEAASAADLPVQIWEDTKVLTASTDMFGTQYIMAKDDLGRSCLVFVPQDMTARAGDRLRVRRQIFHLQPSRTQNREVVIYTALNHVVVTKTVG